MRYSPAAAALALLVSVTASSGQGAPPVPLDPRAATLVAQGRADLQAGKVNESVDSFESALTIQPGHVTIYLNLGEATDIAIQYKQTAFATDGLPERAFETEQQIALANAKAEPVTVRLVERFPGAAKIVSESQAHESFSGSEATWSIAVPAGGKATLTYRVRVQRPR